MRLLLYVVLGAGAAGSGQADLTNLAALVVALGTAAAGVVAYLRLRQERPKIVAELAGLDVTRLRDELTTAWAAVDRLREEQEQCSRDHRQREAELEEELSRCHVRIGRLEQERDAQALRIAHLEARLGRFDP